MLPVDASTEYFDFTKLSQGVVSVNATVDGTMAVRITKENKNTDYIVKGLTQLPLQHGNGEYTLYALKKINGNQYKVVQTKKVTLRLEDPTVLYLQSVQKVEWSKDDVAIKKAEELTKEATTDQEKIRIIYDYIYDNVAYDYNKENQLTPSYLPNIDTTIATGQGICYDYASLYASMLRSQGIPTKLIMGRKDDIDQYHAWNQVYIKETQQWMTVDITYDVTTGKKELEKNALSYIVENTY